MANEKLFTELLIIGAGPYGLAAASYAKQAGIDFRLMGKMLDFFEHHTPEPMVMATSYETAIKDPKREMTLRRYCSLKGIPVIDAPGRTPSHFPPRQLFLSYAHWWVAEMGLTADPRQVTTMGCRNGGFEAVLEDGVTVSAGKVVVATGMYPHRFIPPLYRERLPKEIFSHNTDTVNLEAFASKRVLVVGGGFSAVEWAIYLSEAGAEATCIYRGEWLSVEQRFALTVFKWRDLSETDYLWWQRLKPEEREENLHLMKIQHRNGVPPWLKGRETNVRFLPKTDVQDCQERGGLIQVTLNSGEKIEVDRIILGTGFRPDISNLPFLDSKTIVGRLERSGGFPVLDKHFQSSVSGLYFSGALAIEQFGPVLWFVSGSGIAPPHIFKHILSKNV
jgi:thioredoxin reductase